MIHVAVPRALPWPQIQLRPVTGAQRNWLADARHWILRPQSVLDLAGLCLFIFGVCHTFISIGNKFLIYDEGILLTDANLMQHGYVPHRDFYANYCPGVFLVIAALWKVFGISGIVHRLLGIFLHFVIAAAGGRIAGRVGGRQFSWFACGLILVWTSSLAPVPYASELGMTFALVAIELFLILESRHRPASFVLFGIAVGSIGCFRHDLFVYFCVGFVGAGIAWLITAPTLPGPRFRACLAWTVAGVAIPLLFVWLPIVARAGIQPVLKDLLFDQVRYILPARRLPIPPVFALTTFSRFSLMVPAFLNVMLHGAVMLCLLSPLWIGCLMLLRGQLDRQQKIAVLFAGAFALVAPTYMWMRPDHDHSLYALPAALTLGAGLLEVVARRSGLWWARMSSVAAGLFLFVSPVREQLYRPLEINSWRFPSLGGRTTTAPAEGDQSRTIAFISANTEPGEGIYSGNTQHRRVGGNDMSLYFLTDRPGVTRYMQFDPNMTTRLDIQQQVTRDLDAKQVRIAVLFRGGYHPEPNESQNYGATWLDDYLASSYDVVGGDDNYVWLRRKEAD